MIRFYNIQKFSGLAFETYLAMEPLSNSWLKNERNGISQPFEATASMQLGSLVDGIITSPGTVDMSHELYKPAKNIAHSIQKKFGHLIRHMEKQPSFVGKAVYCGHELMMKTRPDLLIKGIANIDLKITKSKDIRAIIERFRYEDQIWLQSKLGQTQQGFLMIYSLPLRDTVIIETDVRPDHNTYYGGKILKLGTLQNAA